MVCPQWCEAFYSAIPEVRGRGLSHARKCMEVPNVPKQNSMTCLNRYWWILHDISVCVCTYIWIKYIHSLPVIPYFLMEFIWDTFCAVAKFSPVVVETLVHYCHFCLLIVTGSWVLQDFDCARLQISIYGATAGLPLLCKNCTPEAFWNTDAQMSANAYIHEKQ